MYNRTSLPLYSKLVIDPLARVISTPIINFTRIKPYQVTLFGLILSFLSAFLFYYNNYLFAALLFQFTVILDSVDGYIARIKKNGSVFGILLDGYSDIIRVFVNIFAIIMSQKQELEVNYILMIFLFLNFAETWIDFEIINVQKFLSRKNDLKLNILDQTILEIKTILERVGLRTIFLYYQERIFCVLFLGPILGNIRLWTIVGIVLVLLSIHLKMILDVALIKNMIIHDQDETLRSSTIKKS